MTSRTAIVLGAGMVGVCCGLALRRRGLDVVVVDRKQPGQETSYGNSGVLSRSSIFPINGPGLLRQLPRYALNRHPAVRWRFSLLTRPRWTAGFLAACTHSGTQRRARSLDELIRLSMGINRRLFEEAALSAHLRETGWLKLWRTAQGPALARAEAAALATFDIAAQLLDEDGIARLEPAAARVFTAGLLVTASASVDDPAAVVSGYAAHLADRGGILLKAEVRALLRTNTGWRVETTAGPRDADHVVVALGPWSADILRPLGIAVPLGFERGYHVHLASPAGGGPQRAVHDVDGGYVVSPMRAGARVTTGVELAGRDDPPRHGQIDRAARLAAETFGLGVRLDTKPWLGARPTLPDSLPMIGAFPGLPGLHAAFGHQHIGFSTGAGTGEIVAAMIAGAEPPIEVGAFAPGRSLRRLQ